MLKNLKIKTHSRTDFIDITKDIQSFVSQSKVQSGYCIVFIPHTTAGVFINENADPTVTSDIGKTLERVIPWKADYHHLEGNSAAHIKSILTGSSVQIIIENNRLLLGTWQGVFFAEYDGPRDRTIVLKIIED